MANFLEKVNYSTMSMPKAMNRTNPAPLDASAVWTSLDELRNYAATSAVAYVGQILSLVAYDAETQAISEVKAYIIKDTAGNIEEVGSATLGDNKGISLENGTLSLKNWNKKFFKRDPENEGEYIEVEVSETNPWQAGLQPRVYHDGSEFVLAWYEPSTQTIEGVDAAVSSLTTTVQGITNTIGSASDAAGANTLYGAINKVEEDNAANAEAIKELQEAQDDYLPLAGGTLTGDLTLADGAKAASETVVDTKIAAAIGSAGHLKREIVDSLPAVDSEDVDDDTIYMVKVKGKDEYQEYIRVNGAFELIGNTAVDLTPYAQKVVPAAAGNIASLAVDGALTDSGLAAQEVADHLDDEVIHITAQERTDWNAAKATADQAAADIAALVKISQDDANKLAALPAITEIGAGLTFEDGVLDVVVPDAYELPAATADTIGGVKVADVANTGLVLESDGSLAIGISANANGLKKNADGLALELATADNAGAMSAAMFNKLTAIAEGAQVNVVEGALLDGVAAAIENKQIVIPTASASAAGLVYSTDADNGVAVSEDGTMSVNRVSTSKLFVPEGEELVLNGGAAQ